MRHAVILASVVAVAVVIALLMITRSAHAPGEKRTPVPAEAPPARIVCLSPGITETVFALGLGDRVVGVTSHTFFPPEAARIAQVGDWLATNCEAVVALRPDLVLVSSMEASVAEQFKTLGLHYLVVKQDSVGDILNSITELGSVCGVPEAAQTLIASINERLQRIEKTLEGRSRPRVLVCAGRDYTSSKLDQVYIAGRDSFYSELVRMGGGENAFQNGGFPFPTVSGEGIMQLNPEVILEIVPEREQQGLDRATLLNAWKALPDVAAVKNGRVYLLDGDYISIPGPRVAEALEAIARALHPEAGL
ncbi:MAG: ABC transporter substrate-binding protein [Candidatus Hydrogenedentes bacterium]|nr:ABC transporter substrate-binding protein [Candidatus Hydrogenedentota bacterium]